MRRKHQTIGRYLNALKFLGIIRRHKCVMQLANQVNLGESDHGTWSRGGRERKQASGVRGWWWWLPL